jgi:hypothetical protein
MLISAASFCHTQVTVATSSVAIGRAAATFACPLIRLSKVMVEPAGA